MTRNLNEETTTGSIAGHSRPVDTVIRRIDTDEEDNKCPYCSTLAKTGGRVKCGHCGR